MEINITLLVQLVMFLLLLSWLSKLLFKPMIRLFDEREKRIEGAQKEAAAMQVQAHERLMAIEEKIRQAQSDARKEMVSLKEEAAHYQQALLDKTKEESKAQLEAARNQLAANAEVVRQQLAAQTPQLRALVMQKILGESPMPGPANPSLKGSKMECSNA